MKCKQYNIIATFIFMLSFLCLFPQKVSAQQTKSNNTQASVQSQASIRLNKAGSVVERGQKVKLKARISNSRSKKVVWKSSKRRVATVNRNGQVIARGKGTAVITAKIAGTNVYAQSVVTMRVRTTGYCNCRSCAGKWAGCATASGTRPKEKRTIAVDKHLIHLGTKVKIDGKNQRTVLSPEEIEDIIHTFNNFESKDDFSVVVDYEKIEQKKCSFSAGQYFEVKIEYVELTQEEFKAKMDGYTEKLTELFAEGNALQAEIMEQLKKVKYE